MTALDDLGALVPRPVHRDSDDRFDFYDLGVLRDCRLFGLSTPATRTLLLDGTAVGDAIRRPLLKAATFLRESLGVIPSASAINQVCVLRDGLNFDLSGGGAPVATSFLGFGRDGIAPIFQYARWALTPGASIYIADIVATGGTLNLVLDVLVDECESQLIGPTSITVFLVGTANGLAAAAESLSTLKDRLPSCRTATIVVLEGAFSSPTAEQLGQPLFGVWDVLQREMLALPEFHSARLARYESWVEASMIYDGGDRSFSPAEHFQVYARYWTRAAEVYSSAMKCAERRSHLGGSFPLPQAWGGSSSDADAARYEQQVDLVSRSDWGAWCASRVASASAWLNS
jgi:hypothetical protein